MKALCLLLAVAGSLLTVHSQVSVNPGINPGMPIGRVNPTGQVNPGLTPVIPGLTPVNPGLTPINPSNPGLTPVNPGLTPINPSNPGLTPVNPGLTPVNPSNPGLTPVNPGLTPVNPWYPGYNPVNPVNPYYPYPYPWNPTPVPSAPAISKCSSSVMDAIKKNFWSTYGVPTNVINTFMNNGKEIVWKTTSQYYKDQPVCVYSYFFKKYFSIYKLTGYGFTTTEAVNVEEIDGALYDSDTQILRVMIMIYCGVTLDYTCSMADDAVSGPAQGLIKYAEVNSDLNFAFFQAPFMMQSLGITLTDEYALTC